MSEAVKHESVYEGWESLYRNKLEYDSVHWGSHCVDCYPGSCPMKVYVKDGFAEFTPDTLNVLAEQAVNLSGAGAGVVDGLIKDAEKSLEEAKDDAERFLASAAIEALKTA